VWGLPVAAVVWAWASGALDSVCWPFLSMGLVWGAFFVDSDVIVSCGVRKS